MKTPSLISISARCALLASAIATLFTSQSAYAGNTWDGGGANSLWNTAANWNPDGIPATGASQSLTFGGTVQLNSQNDFASGTQFQNITFNAGSGNFTLSGNSIGLNGNITNNSTAIAPSIQTINLDLVLTGGNRDMAATNTGNQIILGGVISNDSTARRLQATGLGTVTLNGTAASTYTGATAASGNGTMVIDLSNIAGNTNLVSTSSQLWLGNGNASSSANFILKGAASGTSSQTMNGFDVEHASAGTVTVNANGGAGTNLNLGTSVTRVTNGSTVVFDITSTGASLNGTTLGLAAGTQTSNQAVRGYALVRDAGGIGFAANVGTSLVRYTGADALATTGNSVTNNYSLAAGGTTTTLTGGSQGVNTLNITTSGSAGILDLGAGSTLTLGSGSASNPGAVLTQGNAALTIQNGQLGADNTEVILHAMGTGGVTINSNISSGTGSLTKAGSDTVTLSGNNTYTGETAVTGGTLRAGSATAFSAGSSYNMANTGGVGLSLNGNDVTIGALAGGGTIGGGINLGANTAAIGGKNTSFDYSGIITGTGGINKVGTGTFQAFGVSTYTGATTISGGILRVRNGGAIGTNSALTIGSAGTLELFNNTVTVGSLSGSGKVSNNYNSANNLSTLVTGGDNTSTTFSGIIENGTGSTGLRTALTKTGTGTLTLSGANTYTGNTTINAGAITLDTLGSMTFAIGVSGTNTQILGTGALTLNGAFNFDLALASSTGTWNLVNVSTLNETYGSSFKVNGFTESSPDVWTYNNGTSIYTFTETTGVLNAVLVPEPSALALAGAGLLGLTFRRNRRKN